MNKLMLKTGKNTLPNTIFWLTAFLLLFWGLGQKALWGSEDRWAEIVRSMLLTRDFFHPSINGLEYFDKPLLGYWLIVLTQAITGSLNELAVRLPSAIAGLVVLWGTVRLGSQLWSEEVGRTAGWLLLTSYALLFWARIGEADMENLATITMAVAWYWHRREKPVFLTYFVFYLICFAGAHTKGLTAVIVPVLAILPDLLRQYRWKTHLNPGNVLALIVGGAIYLIPFVIANSTSGGYHSSGLYQVFRENILRYFQPFDHKEPFYVYFLYVPSLLLPWTPLFLGSLFGSPQLLRTGDKNTRWLVETMVIIFVFFTLSGSRRNYYILPIIPFCALYMAVFLQAAGNDKVKRIFLSLQVGLLSLVALVELLTPVLWPVVRERVGFVPPESLALFTPLIGIFALGVWLLHLQKTSPVQSLLGISRNIGLPVLSAVILVGGFFCWQHIVLDVYRAGKPFAMELKAEIDRAKISPEDIAFYGKPAKDVAFYLDQPKPIQMLTSPEEASRFFNSPGGVKLIIARQDCQNDLLPLIPPAQREKPLFAEKVYPWEKRKAFMRLSAWKIAAGSSELSEK
ncbi:MAG: glycosyltransferase family 39 protein [Proteobacteria bacterium]|nr:glycosyltransferase family 39 protein [Pseudomonadota bacterium]MBU0968058.1 glycosyltransferase family 39 protein [Pseudomonadota bacterium]